MNDKHKAYMKKRKDILTVNYKHFSEPSVGAGYMAEMTAEGDGMGMWNGVRIACPDFTLDLNCHTIRPLAALMEAIMEQIEAKEKEWNK